MPKFIPVSPKAKIKTGAAKPFTVEGENILLANIDGEFFAIEDQCSQEDSPLSPGCLKGDLIDCTLHGSRFSVKTRHPVEEPAVDSVKTYEVRVTDDMIDIQLG